MATRLCEAYLAPVLVVSEVAMCVPPPLVVLLFFRQHTIS